MPPAIIPAGTPPRTEEAQHPFFSPDGEWIAFFADRKLKRVAVAGGSPISICDAPVVGHGGSWSPDGTIVFDPGDVGLLSVAATGGAPEPLTSQDHTIDTGNISWPHFLPGGRALVGTVGLPGGATSELAVLSTQTRKWHRLGPGSQAQYLPSGHLLYHAPAVREGELHAVPFDAGALTLRGTPFLVIDTVFRAQNGGGVYFAAAQDGTLTYTPGGYARTLVRVDRNGRRTPLADERRGFRHPEISPDGLRVAVTVDPRPSQVWVYDLARRSGIPLATTGHNLGPVWSPDGTRIAYSSDLDTFSRAADASGEAERLLARGGTQYPTSWSPDGQLLLLDDGAIGTRNTSDIWALTRQGTARRLLATPYEERGARLSPDGRRLAYHSDESGRLEVHVRPFLDVSQRKWTISTAGGRRPVWSSKGHELFYASGSAVMRVAVSARGDTFSAGTPELLFSGPFDLATTDFSVTPDGSDFIMIESDPNARPTLLHIVLNVSEELRRLAAASPGPRGLFDPLKQQMPVVSSRDAASASGPATAFPNGSESIASARSRALPGSVGASFTSLGHLLLPYTGSNTRRASLAFLVSRLGPWLTDRSFWRFHDTRAPPVVRRSADLRRPMRRGRGTARLPRHLMNSLGTQGTRVHQGPPLRRDPGRSSSTAGCCS